MGPGERLEIGNRISRVTLILNVLLSLGKLVAGITGRSGAMVADAVHSFSDVSSTIAVMVGLHLAGKPADEDHPYGHEKIEPVVAKLIAGALLFTALGIGYNGVARLITGGYQSPGLVALYAAFLSLLAKEGMYHYTVRGAKKIGSPALLADAWHHRSDAFSSLGTLAGIGGARLGYGFLDPAASVLISFFIIKVSLDIFRQSINQLIDCSGDRETVEKIYQHILNIEGVKHINQLKTRVHGSILYVDVEIAVDRNLSVVEGHDIAEKIHHQVEGGGYGVKHCMVHVEPDS